MRTPHFPGKAMTSVQVQGARALENQSIEEKNQELEGYLRELDFEAMPAEEMLRWASETFPGRAVINTSFQYTGVVMIHMAVTQGLDLRFATIDTLRLHPETYEFMEEVKRRYGCQLEVIQPRSEDVGRMVGRFGEYLFFDSKEKQEYCCQVRKVWPQNALLKTADCWIAGLRWDQSEYRRDNAHKASLVNEYGTRRKILKLCPLVDWAEERLLDYIRENEVPVHPLYGQGYPSFGCIICATPVRPGEPKRAGRWRWFNASTMPADTEDHKECGLHYNI
jgi:phosphoadenosine phosphosulfate reductase